MTDQITLRILKRLAKASYPYVADQSYATDSRCELAQPISVEERIELGRALDEAWEHIETREAENSTANVQSGGTR